MELVPLIGQVALNTSTDVKVVVAVRAYGYERTATFVAGLYGCIIGHYIVQYLPYGECCTLSTSCRQKTFCHCPNRKNSSPNTGYIVVTAGVHRQFSFGDMNRSTIDIPPLFENETFD